ncbi:MAG TPA: FkbM family methyltransferase [Alphaproteobacteria bacterium]|nr:FkbM family methyltransferase [Alphaproteobacteria bacterium]
MFFQLVVKFFNPLLAKNVLIPSSLVKKVVGNIHLSALQGRHGSQPMIVETCAGRMELSASEITSCFPLLFRVWEPAIARFVEANLKPGHGFVDIGANIGFYTLLAHKLGARPTAFEPSPRVLPLLYRNLDLNGIDHSVVECIALSDRSGTAQLFEGPVGNQGRSSLSPDNDQLGNASHLVRTAPVEAYAEVLQASRMIKIDVEGHEAHLLKYILSNEIALRDDFIIVAEIDLRNSNGLLKLLKEKMKYGLQVFWIENDYTVRFYRKKRFRVTRMREQTLRNLGGRRVDVIMSSAPVDFPASTFDLN